MPSVLCLFIEKAGYMVQLSERVGKYIDTKEFLKTKDSGFTDGGSTRAKRKHEGSNKSSGKKLKLNQQRGSREQAPMTFTQLF